MHILSSFEFLTLEGVFVEIKNNYKNIRNKNIFCCFAKFSVNEYCTVIKDREKEEFFYLSLNYKINTVCKFCCDFFHQVLTGTKYYYY